MKFNILEHNPPHDEQNFHFNANLWHSIVLKYL